jgi:hypothetical protein
MRFHAACMGRLARGLNRLVASHARWPVAPPAGGGWLDGSRPGSLTLPVYARAELPCSVLLGAPTQLRAGPRSIPAAGQCGACGGVVLWVSRAQVRRCLRVVCTRERRDMCDHDAVLCVPCTYSGVAPLSALVYGSRRGRAGRYWVVTLAGPG